MPFGGKFGAGNGGGTIGSPACPLNTGWSAGGAVHIGGAEGVYSASSSKGGLWGCIDRGEDMRRP